VPNLETLQAEQGGVLPENEIEQRIRERARIQCENLTEYKHRARSLFGGNR
jgi:hypothetical protein